MIFHYSKFFAEGAGFEPAYRLSAVAGLANRWYQPLTHPSEWHRY